MTNEQLVIRIKAGEDVGVNMETLYRQVHPAIRSMAMRYQGYEDREDLEQEGYLALYAAIDGYDPAAGYKFLTYAGYHIRQRMKRYIQNNGSCLRLPAHCLESVREYHKCRSAFYARYGREPSEGETAYLMGVAPAQIRKIKEYACLGQVGSLDCPVEGVEGGGGITLVDVIASDQDMEGEILEGEEYKQLRDEIWGVVDTLEGRQAKVIRSRYQLGMTLKEIGCRDGETTETIRNLEKKAMRELRRPDRSGRLQRFLPEVMEVVAYAGSGVRNFDRTWTSSTERTALQLMEMRRRDSGNRQAKP